MLRYTDNNHNKDRKEEKKRVVCTERRDTAHGRGERGDVVRIAIAEVVRSHSTCDEETPGYGVEVVVVRRVTLTPEHVQHPSGHAETTKHVDGRHEHRGSGQSGRHIIRHQPTTHQVQATHAHNTGDGVSD